MYNQFQRFIATILTLSLVLQSCTSNFKLDTNAEEKQIKLTKKPLTKSHSHSKGGQQAKEKSVPESALLVSKATTRHLNTSSKTNLSLLKSFSDPSSVKAKPQPCKQPFPNQKSHHSATGRLQPTQPSTQQRPLNSSTSIGNNTEQFSKQTTKLDKAAQAKHIPTTQVQEHLATSYRTLQHPQPSIQQHKAPERLQSGYSTENTFTTSEGQQVQLVQTPDTWWAQVTEHLGTSFCRQVLLPVFSEHSYYQIENLLAYEQERLQHLLHVAKQGLIEFVYLGKRGLPGGMVGADEEKESDPPRKAEEQKAAELPQPFQQPASRAAVQTLLEQREDLTSTAALVAALATAQPHEQPALQRWLQGYIAWFTQQPLATLAKADIQDYTSLANIEASTPECRQLLASYLFSLTNRIQPGQYGETHLLEALEYSLQRMDHRVFDGNPDPLIQLGKTLLQRLEVTENIFSASTYPTYRPILYALHQVLVLTQRIAPGQWSTLQEDGLYFRFKTQLEAMAGQAQHYPFVYHSLVVQQSLQRLEREEERWQENLERAMEGLKGTFHLYQGLRALASLEFNVVAFQAGYESLQKAFERKRVEGLAWYDWLQALNDASLLSLAHEEAYNVFEQWLGAMKLTSISEETGCKALHYGIVGQLGTLALEALSPAVRAASIAQLDELTKTEAWADDPALMEALLNSLATVAIQNQTERVAEALQARSILEALVRNGSIVAPSKSRFGFGSRKRNTDPSAAQSTIQAWLGSQTLDDKLRATSPQPAAPAQAFAQVGQQLGLIFPIARATSQQWLKEFYEQSFGQVSRLLCQGPFLAIQALDCALLLQEEKFQTDPKQQARAEAAGLPKPLVQVKTPIHWTTMFQPRSTREGEPAKEVQQVFVVGDPSIGKTTLSRKLAYAWAQGKWESELQAVYVLPFRELAQQHAKVPSLGKAAMRLEAAIADLCFPGVQDPATRSSLQLTLRHSLKRPDTLVILDAPEDCPEISKPLLAQAQAGRHKLLVLSRPAAKQAQPVLDLTIAHAGLHEAQVAAYVHTYFKSPEKAQGLLKLLKDHEVLQTLSHVPVHLAALCALWQDYAEDLDEETLSTLPSLYRQLTGYMWERYAQQHNAQCTVVQWLQNKHRDRLFKILGLLALYGLKKGEVRMSHRAVKDILDNVPRNKEMEQLLAESGFLQVQEKSYQFLHPSFQTYFAGRLLARQLSGSAEEQASAQKFLAKHQSQSQYRALLPFVVEEVGREEAGEGMRQLLSALNANAPAVADLAHLRLQLQCVDQWLCQQEEAVKEDLASLEAAFGFMAALKEQLHQGLAQAREEKADRALLEELLAFLRPLKALVAYAPEVLALLQPALQDQDAWLRAAAHQALGALSLQQLMELYWASNDPVLVDVMVPQLCAKPPIITEGSQPGYQRIEYYPTAGLPITWEQTQAEIQAFAGHLKDALLRAAVAKNDIAAMQALLAGGANANARANDGTTALMSAVAQGHSAAMELLLKHGAAINATDDKGLNALMVAAYSGQVDALRTLLANAAAVDATTVNGWTPLMGAGAQANPEALALLLEKGAAVNAKRTTDGWTALMATAKHGHPAGLQLLVAHQADLSATDHTGKTALVWAAVQGQTEAVALLVASGADANAALLWAAEQGDVQAAQTLIASGANAQATLMQAAEQGQTQAVQTLIASGADVDATLQRAAEQGQTQAIQTLIVSGADVNAALQRAAEQDHTKAVQTLMASGADATAVLSQAAAQGHTQAVQTLIVSGADVDVTLQRAAENDNITAARRLIEHGADANAAFRWAAENGHTVALALLLANGAAINATDEQGQTSLIKAAAAGHIAAVELLLTRGAHLRIKDRQEQTALMWAESKDHTEVVALLRAKEQAMDAALIKAAKAGDTATVALLLDRGANIHATDNRDCTALMLAALRDKTATVGLLLDRGADIEATTNNGITVLMLAAKRGSTATVALLLDRGADIEAKNKWGWTALMHAVEEGHTATMGLLLDRGADIEATTNNGSTALMCAVEEGHTATVQLLLDRGADIHAANKSGKNALAFAIEKGKTEVAQLLRERGAIF